ncbi:MAG: hypothetical protein HS126_33210 [Anaerolineales bacterium]|nr:hypothetical protein [Anaerolineales bacterium]
MNARQAKQTVKEWVKANIESWPGIRGAHLVGGVTTMPDEATFPDYKDIDLHLIFEEGSPALQPADPFMNILEIPYKGLMLEGGLKSLREYQSVKVVLSNPEIAHHFTVDSLLYDPSGWLRHLQQQVKREFPRRQWVLARCEHERNGLKKALEMLPLARGIVGGEVLTLGYTTTFISSLLSVATLQSPTTGSRVLIRLREILTRYDRLDLYERFLAILGVENMSPERVAQLLQEGIEAFDLAVQIRRTPHPAQHKLHPHLRPYFVNSCQRLLDEGYYGEAGHWLALFHLSSIGVIMVDGPDGEKPRFAERSRRFLKDLGMDTAAASAARFEQANGLYVEFFALARDIISRHPGIVD